MHLIGSFGDEQNALVKEYLALEKKLTAEKQRVQAQKDAADVMLSNAKAKVESDNTEIAHAHVRLTATVIGILGFEKAATSASSPILGPTLLTAQQLADFVRAMHYTPRLTVSLDDLAQDYIVEGQNAGCPRRRCVRPVDPGDRRLLVPRRRPGARQRQQLRGDRRLRQLQARLLVRHRADRGARPRCRRCGSTWIRRSPRPR